MTESSRPHVRERGPRARWVPAALIVVACVLSHGVGVFSAYSFDDDAAVLGHPAVTGAAHLLEVFTREYWGRPLGTGWSSSYRPVTSLTFAVVHRLSAGPLLHHLVNLLLFVSLTLGLWRWLQAPTGARLSRPASLGGALLFAVWPVHVENVASVVGRADVLAAALALVALTLAAQRARSLGRHAALATAGALAYVLALLSKETVALLPALSAWLLAVRWRRTGAVHRRDLLGPGALAVAGLVYIAARQAALPVGLPPGFVGADNVVVGLSGPARWWANLGLLGTYGELALVPLRLCADHTYADVTPPTSPFVLGSWRAWAALVVVARCGWDAWRTWQGRAPGLWVAFALSYLLVGQWVVDLSVTLAERIFLWPSLFLAGALAHDVERLSRRLPASAQRRMTAALAVLALLFAARSAERSYDWRTPLSLYRSSAERCPAAVHNRLHLARAWRRAGRADEALWHYAVAIAGHKAWPGPFDPPALAAERTTPLPARLRRLPELVDLGGTPDQVWPALVSWLRREGALAEARLAQQLSRAPGGPSEAAP